MESKNDNALLAAEKAYRDHIDGRPMVHAIEAYLRSTEISSEVRKIIDGLYKLVLHLECLDSESGEAKLMRRAIAILTTKGDASPGNDEVSSNAVVSPPMPTVGHLPSCDLNTSLLAGCSCGWWRDEQDRPLRWKGVLRDKAEDAQ